MLSNRMSWSATREMPAAVAGGIGMSAFARLRALGTVGVQAQAAVDAPYAAKGATSAWSPPV